jgi:hypothetical protein
MPLAGETGIRTGAKSFAVLAVLFCMILCVPGCGSSADSIASRSQQLFQSAPPQTKAAWDNATAALKSNDYAGALTNLQWLAAAPGLTPEQARVVQQTATAVSDQMYAAVNRGDANGKKAIETLRKVNGR